MHFRNPTGCPRRPLTTWRRPPGGAHGQPDSPPLQVLSRSSWLGLADGGYLLRRGVAATGRLLVAADQRPTVGARHGLLPQLIAPWRTADRARSRAAARRCGAARTRSIGGSRGGRGALRQVRPGPLLRRSRRDASTGGSTSSGHPRLPNGDDRRRGRHATSYVARPRTRNPRCLRHHPSTPGITQVSGHGRSHARACRSDDHKDQRQEREVKDGAPADADLGFPLDGPGTVGRAGAGVASCLSVSRCRLATRRCLLDG